MLDSLTLTNFRAFKQLSLDFTKLNVFVGPNNSGKSSIVSAINLLAQNIKRDRAASGLSLNGSYADLGAYYDVIHGHKANSNMKIEFAIDKYEYEYNFRYRIQRRETELFKAVISSPTHRYTFLQKKDGATHSLSLRKSGRAILLGKLRPRVVGLSFILPMNQMVLNAPETERETYNTLRVLLQRATSRLDAQFRYFDSLGAFRSPPQRTYVYSGETPKDVGRNGENSAEIIASSSSSRERESRALMQRTSEWFRAAGVANGIQIRPLTNRHFELTVEDRVGFSNNIVDVGFGCSQALPVVIGGYKVLGSSRPDIPSMYVVQEPEIHLHPNAAAQMGTFFCQLASNGTQCFVETHSDALVLRVARHVALKQIAPNDVRVYWVSDRDGPRGVTVLKLRDDGSFETDWPGGFFPTRSAETLELARAAANLPNAIQLELALHE